MRKSIHLIVRPTALFQAHLSKCNLSKKKKKIDILCSFAMKTVGVVIISSSLGC